MATNAKPLYLKSGRIRSVYGREGLGLEGRKSMTIQETDPQNNSPVIIAPVFGTQQVKDPPNSIVEQLDRIIGQFEAYDNIIQSALICWTEPTNMQFGSEIIMINTSKVRTKYNQRVEYLFNDSVFPVLMTAKHKPLPSHNIYDDLPNGYTCGLYLALVQKDNVESKMRSVIFLDNPTNTRVSRCPTYSAQLICYLVSIEKKDLKLRLVNRVLERHCLSFPVWGMYSPLNYSSDFVAMDCDRFPVMSNTTYLSDRLALIVSNDGLLCVTQVYKMKKNPKTFSTSLLKEDTFYCCEGIMRVQTPYSPNKSSIANWTIGLPYRQIIIIVGEGLHSLTINSCDCPLEVMGDNQLRKYVFGIYFISRNVTEIMDFDWIQLSKDLTETIIHYSIEPVMRLDNISDAFIYKYRHKGKTVGHLVFALSFNIYDKGFFKDTFNVFIASDDTNWSANDSLYLWVGLCTVCYNKGWDNKTMTRPDIRFYTRSHKYMEVPYLSDKHYDKWTFNKTRSSPVYKSEYNWRKLFLPALNRAQLSEFLNVGTNLVERYKGIQELGFRFVEGLDR